MDITDNFVVTGKTAVIENNFLFPMRVRDGYKLALNGFCSGPICNVNKKNDVVHIVLHSAVAAIRGREKRVHVKITHDYYPTVGQLLEVVVDEVAREISRHGVDHSPPTLKYKADKNLWTLKMNDGMSLVSCKSEPGNIFNTLLNTPDGTYDEISVREGPLSSGIELGFVYCSVVEDSLIDNKLSRLLTIIPIPKNQSYVFFEPATPCYHSISVLEFSNISIEIRDSDGELLEFAQPTERSCNRNIHYSSRAVLSTVLPIILRLTLRKAI